MCSTVAMLGLLLWIPYPSFLVWTPYFWSPCHCFSWFGEIYLPLFTAEGYVDDFVTWDFTCLRVSFFQSLSWVLCGSLDNSKVISASFQNHPLIIFWSSVFKKVCCHSDSLSFECGPLFTLFSDPGTLHSGLPCGSVVQNLPSKQETWVQWLGQKDLEKEMATHSSTLAWRIPWTEEPSGLQSLGS